MSLSERALERYQEVASMTILKGQKDGSPYTFHGTTQEDDDSNLLVAGSRKGENMQV